MTPVSTHRRRLWVFYIPYVVLAVGLFVALHVALDSKDAATQANRHGITTACLRVNELARRVDHKIGTLISASGTSIDPAKVDQLTDPELRAFVQGIVTNGANNRAALNAVAGEPLPQLDCHKLVKHPHD